MPRKLNPFHLSLLLSPFYTNTKISQDKEKLIMECKTHQTEQNPSVSILPLLSIPHLPIMDSPERSGTLTPPIYAAVSIPFRWEEEPGKPRFSSATVASASAAASPSLELPPRLLLIDKVPRSECCSSFRMMGSSSFSPDEKSSLFMKKGGWFGSWRKRGLNLRGKREQIGIGGLVFPSMELEESLSSKVEASRLRRNGSFSSLMSTHIRPHFWESVCEGLKHMVPSWRSKRLKRET
ncbi:uncharacterized protein At4g00950-like [Benincasa hispida]|uniref:uncharacterized protein At4g00950-like n=1 Tax=Benincasa hispida TaxID=102211 RepID=UPI001901F365|nr:uncharacterized protein At4g00950-like [Benincasa hispida]